MALEVVHSVHVHHVGHLSIPLALLKSWHSVHVEPIVVHVVVHGVHMIVIHCIHVVVVHGVHMIVVHLVVVHCIHIVVVHVVHVVVHVVVFHGPVVTPVGVVSVSVPGIGLSNSEGGETDLKVLMIRRRLVIGKLLQSAK